MNETIQISASSLNGIDLSALAAFVDQVKADPAKAAVRFRVTTRWSGQTRSETTVEGYELGGQFIERRFKMTADEPLDLLGTDSAPNPQELLMTALNACMAVGYVAQAAVHGIQLERLEIETSGRLDLRGFLGVDDTVAPGYRQLDYTVRIGGNGTAEQFHDIHQAVMNTLPNFFNLNQPICMNGRLELV
ncbi:osmotically inducible protein C [Sphingobium lactosutens]|uniref:OsmC family protein n=1 Tax=Sphingobium lactosutens TaxID=522773 RepID=UPI0015BEEF43|nr:OsmC family protein [Sphingobium lactosutens]NWK96142.1 osmotically inducible protein C [Sphingobium lactosutens]